MAPQGRQKSVRLLFSLRVPLYLLVHLYDEPEDDSKKTED